jgi:glycerol transport system ATP-binding protein
LTLARIELVGVGHTYAEKGSALFSAAEIKSVPFSDQWALQPMDLTWDDGGAYALLGPSGCGKTTLLNVISGLLTPTAGRVLFDGHDVTALSPERRNIAQVFQFPVVYDTMTVYENLAFPLRNRGWKTTDVARRVSEVAEILELTPVLRKRALGLSADEKQKISLGRGLVRPDVAAVLFDEPLTVIDPQLKWLLRRKLKQIHQQLELSLIYVTHDQTEALTFADRIVVMSRGAVVQVGTAEALFERPAHRFVGHFIGSPGMNFLGCSWHGQTARIADVPIRTASTGAARAGARLEVGIRPEYVGVHSTPGENRVPGTILSVQDRGTDTMIKMDVAGSALWARLRRTHSLPEPGPAFAYLPPERCALYVDDVRLE